MHMYTRKRLANCKASKIVKVVIMSMEIKTYEERV